MAGAFDIEAYRRALRSTAIGVRVEYRAATGSTMDDAREGARTRGAASHGTAYVAGEQAVGRGRLGRMWVSAPGAGLYVTYHLCPSDAAHAPLIGLAGGVAVCDAVEATAGLAPALKWPNDVQIEGRKLAGLLAEAQHGARLDVFLGIGVNLRLPPDLPPDVASIATSIEAAGTEPPSRERLLAALSDALDARLRQLAASPQGLLADWQARLATLGQRVRLDAPGGAVEGEAVGVSALGELLLRLDDGTTRACAAGDVTTVTAGKPA